MGRDVELGAVGVGPAVGHRHAAWEVADSQVLIVEGLAVDRVAAGAVLLLEVATLEHEPLDDAVEDGVLVAEAVLAGAQLLEVLDSLWLRLAEEANDDAARWLTVHGDIKVHFVGHGEVLILDEGA